MDDEPAAAGASVRGEVWPCPLAGFCPYLIRAATARMGRTRRVLGRAEGGRRGGGGFNCPPGAPRVSEGQRSFPPGRPPSGGNGWHLFRHLFRVESVPDPLLRVSLHVCNINCCITR